MSGIARGAENVVRSSLEEDDEIEWINNATWNDSLWVENNCTLELVEGGHFYNESEISNCLQQLSAISSEDVEAKDYDVTVDRCSCDLDDWQTDSDDLSFIKESDFCSANMYDNCTDDVKLSLVSTVLKQSTTQSQRCNSSPVKRTSSKLKPCCNHQYKFKEKHDYLRRSSPCSSVPSSPKTSSSSSLNSSHTRQSRSLSPKLDRRAGESPRGANSNGKVYTDCCSGIQQPLRNGMRYHHGRNNIPSVAYKETCSSRARSLSNQSNNNGNSLNNSVVPFSLASRQSRSISPQVTKYSASPGQNKACRKNGFNSCKIDHTHCKLQEHLYYGIGFKTKHRHSIIPVSRQPATVEGKPRSGSLKGTPTRSRSHSTCSLTLPVARRSRSLSPQLIRSIKAHRSEFSNKRSFRDCCNKNYRTSERSPISTKNQNNRTPVVTKRFAQLTPSRQCSNNTSPSPPIISSEISVKNKISKPTAEKKLSQKCRRPCCEQNYIPPPKFDYLRKGGGAKKSTYTPKKKPDHRKSSAGKENWRSILAHKQTKPSSDLANCSNNNNNTGLCLNTQRTKLKSYQTLPSLLQSADYNHPPSITLKPPNLDESDQGRRVGEPLVCDELLLEFPSLYYKLDCSNDAGEDELESRKAKTGTVYRILDDGSVVRDCDMGKEPDTTEISDPETSSELQPNVEECEGSHNDPISSSPHLEVTKEKILADLDLEADTDSGNAVSLYNLITGMSPPDVIVDDTVPSESNLTTDDSWQSSNMLNTESLSNDSPCSVDVDTSPDVMQQSLDDDKHFRPISRDSEYDSEAFSHEDQTELFSTEDLSQSVETADHTFQPIEPVVNTLCTPLEVCFEPIICPRVCRNNRKPGDQQQAGSNTELQVPQSELSRDYLENIENCLDSLPVADTNHSVGSEAVQVTEDTIVPGERLPVAQPTLDAEPSLDKAEVQECISGYSDTDELSETLEQVTEIEPTPSETALKVDLSLLEGSTLDQSPTHLSPSLTRQPLYSVALAEDAVTDNLQTHVINTGTPGSDNLVSSQLPDINVAQPNVDLDAQEGVSSPLINAPSPASSDAFDGDESSEGEDVGPPSKSGFHWPGSELDTQQLVTAGVSPNLEGFERESSADTVRNTSMAEKPKDSSSSDQPVKSTPVKKRRRRRPRTLTGSPKLQQPDGSPHTSASPVQAFPSKHLQPTNQHSPRRSCDYSDDESRDMSPEESQVLSGDDNVASDVISSDNDDLLNSTGLSEGSNWDYYQADNVSGFTFKDPPYSTSTDPEFDVDLEPKLVLQWDDELDANNDDTLTLDVSPRDTRLRVGGGAAAASPTSDSEDSDIEDLHYVIQQSSTQLLQADSALRKPRRDVVQSGIYLDPQKYVEWHATCQTNIKCLQVIQEHLESEKGLPNLTDDDIQQVLDLIKKWQSLEKIALERKHQSSTLCKIYSDIQSGRKLVRVSEEELSVAAFNDVGELENHFRSLQTFKVNLQSQTHRLQQVMDSILVFESENKKVKMAGFKQLVDELKGNIKPTILNIGKKTTELQYAIVHWHKWNSDCKELETVLVKTLYDIEPAELGLCEQRLVELEASFSEYSSVCTVAAHNFTEEKLASLRARLNHLVSESTPSSMDTTEELDSLQMRDDGLEGQDVPEHSSLDTSHQMPLFPREDMDSGLASGLSPPPLSLGSSKLDSHKSSMESGIATMDTERSVGGDNTEELSQAAIHQETSRSEDFLGTVEVVVPQEPQQTIEDIAYASSSADLIPSVLSADDTALSADGTVNEQLDTSAVPGAMGPLSVDVEEGHDMANSDHQTPPTVEDLAPTLPITDQEKMHVANRSKKNKKNRRKGKNKAKYAAAFESESAPIASSLNQTDNAQTCDQSTVTDFVPVESVELQTDNSKLFANSFTNTELNTNTQSQTDLVPTTDQSTYSDSQHVFSQGMLTERARTSSATNQTDALVSSDQFTETDRTHVDVAANQTDIELQDEGMLSRSTNTPIHVTSYCQTDLSLSEPTALPLGNAQSQTDKPESVDGTLAELPAVEDDFAPQRVDKFALPPSDDEMAQGDEEAEVLKDEMDEDVRQPVVDHELPMEDEYIDEDMVVVEEEALEEQKVLRHRMPGDADPTAAVAAPPAADKDDIVKPKPRRRWFSPRNMRYLAAILGSLLFIIVLFFLLEPRCCENTRYHKGIFGLRRKYTDLPPH